MEINNNQNSLFDINQNRNRKNPTFKAGFSPMNLVGNSMQWIEDKGFLASFLIQDVFGMTVPRVRTAFLRDKEYTGEYNIQEGFEVLGREGLTGPCMMAIAPIAFVLAAKFGKSTNVNTQLIKRFGNSLTEFISANKSQKTILKQEDLFKKEFFSKNIRDVLSNTLGEKHATAENIEYILNQLNSYTITGKTSRKVLKKQQKESITNITKFINDLKYKSSSDLASLGKVKIGNKDSLKEFSIKEAFESMVKYTDDAIKYNKNLDKLDELASERLKNKALAKRIITNISTIVATLGILSILPKIYARSDIAPGAKQTSVETKNNEEYSSITFKGKNKATKSLLERFGEVIGAKWSDKAAEHFEYSGHNFTNTLMATLSLGGLLAPRGFRAFERAQKDENGKKDLSELYEILIRDVISSLTVVFAVPMLTRAFVTSYETNSGFVLMNKNREMTKAKIFKDLLNPYSKTHVFTNNELEAIYNNVNTKEKIINFCEFITKNNGDLYKILSKSDNAVKILGEKGLDFAQISNLDKKAKNELISNFFKNLKIKGKGKVNEFVTEVMKGANNKFKGNKILSTARNLNSLPGAIATFFITPFVLGVAIPKLTYANTRRLHNKNTKDNASKNINTPA